MGGDITKVGPIDGRALCTLDDGLALGNMQWDELDMEMSYAKTFKYRSYTCRIAVVGGQLLGNLLSSKHQRQYGLLFLIKDITAMRLFGNDDSKAWRIGENGQEGHVG